MTTTEQLLETYRLTVEAQALNISILQEQLHECHVHHKACMGELTDALIDLMVDKDQLLNAATEMYDRDLEFGASSDYTYEAYNNLYVLIASMQERDYHAEDEPVNPEATNQ